jgi:acetyl-CoA carboxylase biotin carboxyl carrier protein
MDLARIKALIDLMSQSSITELDLTEGDVTLRLSRTAAAKTTRAAGEAAGPAQQTATSPAPATPESVPPAASDAVRSPSFGVFHRTPAPDASPFVVVGSVVDAGQTLGLIEAMKVFTAIVAPHTGIVDAILAESGAEVEVGQPLFRIKA